MYWSCYKWIYIGCHDPKSGPPKRPIDDPQTPRVIPETSFGFRRERLIQAWNVSCTLLDKIDYPADFIDMGEYADNSDQPTPVTLPNSDQFYLNNDQGRKYLIQVSWPLNWRNGPASARKPLPIMYIVDGNVSFLTATESAWRRQLSSRYLGGGLVVAIGYPLTGKLYDFQRRNVDLTPPTKNKIPGHGGADEFLDFIDQSVRPAIKERYPQLTASREGLYGHSYGGLFVLHALFTRPTMFDGYLASSPSIWWNNRCIMKGAKAFLEEESTLVQNGSLPSLAIFWGSFEQTPPRWDNEPLENYEKRIQTAFDQKMVDNSFGLSQMLRSSKVLRAIKAEELTGEEHVSITPCSVSRSLITFFEDWALENR